MKYLESANPLVVETQTGGFQGLSGGEVRQNKSLMGTEFPFWVMRMFWK
jgi:hypothetical protein